MKARKEKSISFNYFEMIPNELVEYILLWVPKIYFAYPLNLVNRSWYQMIKEEKLKKIVGGFDNNFQFPDYLVIKYQRFFTSYRPIIKYMEIFIKDRNGTDFILKNRVFNGKYMDFFNILFLIKYQYMDLLVKKLIDLETKYNVFENYKLDFILIAAYFGHINIIKYFHENGYPWHEGLCNFTAYMGHLDCLKYLHENGCPWGEEVCPHATENGQLECLKYGYENGCPFNEKMLYKCSTVWIFRLFEISS